MARSLNTVAWTHGTPPFAFCYRDGARTVLVELQSFRPDPSSLLGSNSKSGHPVTIVFENKPHGIQDVRLVSLKTARKQKRTFVRIR